MRTVFAEKLTGAAVERNGQVPAQIAVCDDGATFVAKEQCQNGKPIGIVTELLRADLARIKLVFAADPELQSTQSIPGTA
jgi:hypothetical protein